MNSEQRPEELAATLGRYSLDPYGWVLYAFPWGHGELAGSNGPDAWQHKQLKAIGEKLRTRVGSQRCEMRDTIPQNPGPQPVREATASGHGIGKPALVGWIILWAISTFEGTKGVVTANTEKRLKTKTWSEFAKWFRLCWFTRLRGGGSNLFELTTTAIYSGDASHQNTGSRPGVGERRRTGDWTSAGAVV